LWFISPSKSIPGMRHFPGSGNWLKSDVCLES
jgi:hypothetical protein